MSGFAPDIALSALFQRNAAARPGDCALIAADGRYTYAEAANAVVHLAAQIASLGLPARSSVALLLPNGCELVLSLLAVIQSGHIPVPMPVAWRKSDLVRACREAEAAALITTTNCSDERLPELAAEAAIEVFELSFPCAFGADLPDGILPLSISGEAVAVAASPSPGIATLHPSPGGVSFSLHGDEDLLAAGLGAMLAADMRNCDSIVSAVAPSNLAGLGSAFVPWLLCGGTFSLLSDIPEHIDANGERCHVVAPAPLLETMCAAAAVPLASAIGVHFAGTPETGGADIVAERVVDAFAVAEICLIALPREDRAQPRMIPLGRIQAGNGAAAPVVVETSISETGRMLVRGAMIAKDAADESGWCDTGYASVSSGSSGFAILPPDEIVAIGVLRFSFPDMERRILAAALVSGVETIADPVLGSRLVIRSERPAETSRALLDAGLPRIIASAVRKADNARTATG